jgi:hypothetical protein
LPQLVSRAASKTQKGAILLLRSIFAVMGTKAFSRIAAGMVSQKVAT